MGGVARAIKKIVMAPINLVRNIISPPTPSVVSVPTTSEPAAQPAVASPTQTNTPDTGVDSTGQTLKRQAKGKRGLMIGLGSNTSSGGTGGTGLNI